MLSYLLLPTVRTSNSTLQIGTSPLVAASYSQNLELVELLVDRGACIDTMTTVSTIIGFLRVRTKLKCHLAHEI